MNVWGGIGRAMLSGFNTNFRYRGVLFHVQTEDSGRANPHIITHLFHGGNILASEKSQYLDLLEAPEGSIEEGVRKRMEGQHKAMLKQLSRGGHDAVILERMGSDALEPVAEMPIVEAVAEDFESEADVQSASWADVGEAADAVKVAAAPATPTPRPDSQTAPAMDAKPSAVSDGAAGAPVSGAPEDEEETRFSRVFGERVVSEKPLDEVVLDYLVENARKRKRKPQ